MVKKFKAMAEEAGKSSGLGDSQLAAAIKESAQQIWLAGLGAFAKAQEEGQKVFSALVKQGNELHKRTRDMTGDKVSEVGGKFDKATREFQKQASQSWDKLEQVFEDRVARALQRLGVPTNKDVDGLAKQVETLTAAINKLSGAKPTVKKNASKSAATKVGRTKKASDTKAQAKKTPRKAAGKKVSP